MTGPRPPESSGRPQDAPRFPTYGRPEDNPAAQHPGPGTPYRSPVAPYRNPATPYQSPETPNERPMTPYANPATQYQSKGSPYQQAPGGPQQATPYPGTPYQSRPGQWGDGQWKDGQWREPLPAYPTPYGEPGYGYPGLQQLRTNPLAIAAMVTGLSGIIFAVPAPVAVVLGIIALVQLRRSQEKGFAQAVVGLVVGALATLFWTGILLVALLVGEDTGALGDPGLPAPTASSVGIEELSVGECFDETDDEVMVDRVPCADSHEGEFFASVDLPAGGYPGDRQVADRSETACEKIFARYVGIPIDDSELNLASWSPDQEAWDDGDRRALCAVYGPDEDKVTGSLKGSRR